MIDLDALQHEAARTDGESTVVSRAWLKRALVELRAGRAAEARLRQMEGIGG